jgi:hypothetical protein
MGASSAGELATGHETAFPSIGPPATPVPFSEAHFTTTIDKNVGKRGLTGRANRHGGRPENADRQTRTLYPNYSEANIVSLAEAAQREMKPTVPPLWNPHSSLWGNARNRGECADMAAQKRAQGSGNDGLWTRRKTKIRFPTFRPARFPLFQNPKQKPKKGGLAAGSLSFRLRAHS